MNSTTLEIEIADITKHYMRSRWHLDVSAFKMTKDRAWVMLAGRILENPGAVMPVKSLTDRGMRVGDAK
jgi:hypothetical protein